MPVFGPLVAPWNVEQAVIETLRSWLPAYLLAAEEQNGLQRKSLGRPPAPESYHGGLDWESEQQDDLPEVIVICNPTGEPERSAQVYIQRFEVQVGCVILATEEPIEATARKTAGLWSAATMLLVHHGGLGSFKAEETVLIGSPKVEFLDSENRRLAVGITTYYVYAEILNPNAGPPVVKTVEPEGPYPEPPEATKDAITVVGTSTETPL